MTEKDADKKRNRSKQETRERAKEEPLVKKDEVDECLDYLRVRRELQKRWKDLSERAEWLQNNPLEKTMLRPALITQIIKDFRLESILTADYNCLKFVLEEKSTKDPSVPVAEAQGSFENKENKEEYAENIEHYRYLAMREDLDRPEMWTDAINRAVEILAAESGEVAKEKGVENNGLIKLRHPELPTLIISDIHARRQSLLAILERKADDSGKTFFDYLKEGKINVVCLGDGMHSEGRGKVRWEKALQDGFSVRKSVDAEGEEEIFVSVKNDSMEMNAEMVESLNTMRMIVDLKTAFSDNFHFLRGNHDDILSKDIGQFTKYAKESLMTCEWVKERMGKDFLRNYARFEHSLPLALTGKYFAASHSGPKELLTAAQIKAKDVAAMRGVTFTDNKEIVTEKDKLEKMLAELLPDCEPDERKWFIGHRQISSEKVVQQFGSSRAQLPLHQLNNSNHLSYVVFDPGLIGLAEAAEGLGIKGLSSYVTGDKEQENGRVMQGTSRYLYSVPDISSLPPEEPTLDFVKDSNLFAKK